MIEFMLSAFGDVLPPNGEWHCLMLVLVMRQADLDEVRSMPNPPAGVRLTMQAACIMFDVKPVLKEDPTQLGKKIKDWWSAAYKTLLAGMRARMTLCDYRVCAACCIIDFTA